jgi:hypothetical protein
MSKDPSVEPAAEGERVSATKYKRPNGEIINFPAFLKSGTEFSYTDGVTGLRFNPINPVKVDTAPKPGSILAGQIDAGFIVQA